MWFALLCIMMLTGVTNVNAERCLVYDGAAKTNQWDKQAICTLTTPMVQGETYIVKLDVKADAAIAGQFGLWPIWSTSENKNEWGGSNDVQYLASYDVTTSFTTLTWEFAASFAHDKLQFVFGKVDGNVYIDNVSCVKKETTDEMIVNGTFDTDDISNWTNNWGGPNFQIKDVSDNPLAGLIEKLNNTITGAKGIIALAYTDDSFAVLTQAIADGETAANAVEPTEESLNGATTAINNAIAALQFKENYSSLKDATYGAWSAWGADATLSQAQNPTWELYTATGQSYGDGSVNSYAELSGFDKLIITVASGTPRILLNRDADGGQWNATEAESHLIDNTAGDAESWHQKYFAKEGNVYTVDLKQLVADKGFAHLHAIKSYDKAIVTGLFLYKEATVTPVDGPTIIDWVAADKYTADTDVNGVEINLDEKTTVTFAKNSGTNAKYYNNGGAIRVYKNSTITFKGEGITKIILPPCGLCLSLL